MADKPTPGTSTSFDELANAIYPAPRSNSNSNIPTSINRLNCAQTMESNHNKIAVSSLMSPPEHQPYDTFERRETTPPMFRSQDKRACLPITLPHILSPPVSPEASHLAHTSNTTEQFNTTRDPILYPPFEGPHSHPSLFAAPSTTLSSTVEVVESHISARTQRKRSTPHTYVRDPSPPAPGRDEYLLALEFKATLFSAALANPVRWINRERQYLIDNQRARTASMRKFAPAPSKRVYPQLAPSPTGVSKRNPSRPIKTLQRTPKSRRERVSPTPEAAGRSRNTGASTREDKDFGALPDLCPPLSSLPSRPNSLKVEWKGAPLDLSSDPHKRLLYPDEVLLASNLRLDCATYLTSKRRIFLARLECYQGTWGAAQGKGGKRKEFRKTDAQQACKIDVNKASKLWMAFEKVGWFEEGWCVEQLRKQDAV